MADLVGRRERRIVMAGDVRYNKVIDLLEHGKPVFCSGLVWNGNLDDLTYVADADYDMVIMEMEHEGFSFNNLRTSLQFILNRKRISGSGTLQADPVPLVRIPPNSRETSQWMIKQALDTGVYGLVLPHLNTVEDAHAAVVAARYPQVPGVADFEPEGQRGWWQRIAPRYWGLTAQEYYDAADLWPLDPDGNMLLMGIVEEPEGVNNLPDILKQEKGIGAIWADRGTCPWPWATVAIPLIPRSKPICLGYSRPVRMPGCPVPPGQPPKRSRCAWSKAFASSSPPR